jgi:hypothetical protein
MTASELNLRVSVATLVRVLFENPRDGELMLAFERRATLREGGRAVEVKSQPFGGAIRILEPGLLRDSIGDFHFDSERSRLEQDFRIFVRPSAWESVRDFCIEHLSHVDDAILETDSTRELVEEFSDTLKINLQPGQYVSNAIATIVENEAVPAANIHAKGILTVRIFRIFEAYISDSSLAHSMMKNSDSLSDQDLRELALVDLHNGGKGRANAMLVLPMKHLVDSYLGMPPKERNVPVLFEKHRLDETVAAILEGVTVPKYQRL